MPVKKKGDTGSGKTANFTLELLQYEDDHYHNINVISLWDTKLKIDILSQVALSPDSVK